MTPNKWIAGFRWIVALAGVAGAIAAIAVIPACSDDARAVRLARQKDMPALNEADKVVIQTASWAGSKEVAITGASDLKQLRAALIVEETTPSAGEMWATLTWLKGDNVIRKIWVYEDGEWGFERSIGQSEELVAIIKKHLATVVEKGANKAGAGDGNNMR
jgi:hypothetical protein